jgi:hypothetical protein
MKEIDLFKNYLNIINTVVFPQTETVLVSVEDITLMEDFDFLCAGYESVNDIFIYNQFTANDVIKTGVFGLILGLVNFETDLRSNRPKEIYVPALDTNMWLAVVAAHETRHRMQCILNTNNPIISIDQYGMLKCFEPAYHLVKKRMIRLSNQQERMRIEFDAYMAQHIFASQLWINHNQRGLSFDESVKISAEVLIMPIEKLSEQANQFCYLYY